MHAATKTAFQAIVSNLRHRWNKELDPYADVTIYALYDDFSLSDEFGNNDEKFPDWFVLLDDYKANNRHYKIID